MDPPAVIAGAGDEVVANGGRARTHLAIGQQEGQRCDRFDGWVDGRWTREAPRIGQKTFH